MRDESCSVRQTSAKIRRLWANRSWYAMSYKGHSRVPPANINSHEREVLYSLVVTETIKEPTTRKRGLICNPKPHIVRIFNGSARAARFKHFLHNRLCQGGVLDRTVANCLSPNPSAFTAPNEVCVPRATSPFIMFECTGVFISWSMDIIVIVTKVNMLSSNGRLIHCLTYCH